MQLELAAEVSLRRPSRCRAGPRTLTSARARPQLRGDLSKEEEARLMQRLLAQHAEDEALEERSKEKTREALALEEAFFRIRQATGVNTLDEMVDKFLSQGARTARPRSHARLSHSHFPPSPCPARISPHPPHALQTRTRRPWRRRRPQWKRSWRG